jgi:integrase
MPTLRNFEKEQGALRHCGSALDQRTAPWFSTFAKEWLSQLVGITESQLESDESILRNHLLPFFGEHPLDQVNARLIDRYKAQKVIERHQFGAGYKAKSMNNHLSVLHRIFEKAIEYELVDKNPVTRRAWIPRERTSEDRRNYWTPEEEQKAVATLQTWKELYPLRRIVILIQLMTGLRFGEIRSLETRDVDLKTPGLWIRRAMARKKTGTPKNKQARYQVIPRDLADELLEFLQEREQEDGRLFLGEQGGPLPNNSLNRWYRRLAKQAGITPISSHGARHTSGSTYAVMGAGQKMIAKLLGHSSTKATERYTHIQVMETQRLVEERWARLF